MYAHLHLVGVCRMGWHSLYVLVPMFQLHGTLVSSALPGGLSQAATFQHFTSPWSIVLLLLCSGVSEDVKLTVFIPYLWGVPPELDTLR